MSVSGIDVQPDPRRTEKIIYVSVYLICIIASLVPYLIILKAIFSNSKQFSGSVYMIMLNLGIADCIQLILQLFSFLSTMFDSTFSYWINKIIGTTINGAYFTFISCTLLLAFNRFVILCLPAKISSALDGKVTKLLIGITWLPCLIFFILCMIPQCSMIYFPNSVSWDYTDEDWCPIINEIDFSISVSQIGLGSLLYVIIFAKLIILRKNYHSSDKGELKLLFQAAVLGVYVVFAEVIWHFSYGFIPDQLFAAFFGNILWIGECGLTPFIYLILNNAIRNAFLELLRLRGPKQRSVQTSIELIGRTRNSVFIM